MCKSRDCFCTGVIVRARFETLASLANIYTYRIIKIKTKNGRQCASFCATVYLT